VHHLHDAKIDNISLDLIYGIPGQSPADLRHDLEEALALEPEHLSCYELEAKPGTRFTHTFGDELARQSDALEGYFERVVETLSEAGYRWYETANFCRRPELSAGRDLRSRHNLAYWLGRDYLGIGTGAVSTIGSVRWKNTPRLPAYLEALGHGEPPPREVEQLDADVKQREQVMLGLRLDEPLSLAGLEEAIDENALERLERLGLASRQDRATLTLTRRGRFLGGGVTAELLA
jgi:oxygen-independent coproporphyrinogen-3 oxidase